MLFGAALPWVLGGLASVGGAIFSARQMSREAQRNRDFQERMSSTSHQRAVRDMVKAGINPMLAAGAGASTPSGATAQVPDFGEAGAKAIGTALAVKQAEANIDLTRSQAAYVRAQQHDLQTQAASGRYELIRSQADIAALDARQRTALFDTVIAQARAQVKATTSAGELSRANAALAELDRARAMNAAELEKWLKGGSPGVRLFLDVIRSLRR